MYSGSENPVDAPKPRRITQSFIVRLILGVAIIGIVIASTDFNQIIAVLRGINPVFLVIALAVQVIGNLIAAWRWQVLLDIFEMPASYSRVFQGLYIGAFINNLLPTSFGGDFYRSYWILFDKRLYRKSLFITFVERFVGVITLGYVALPALFVLLIDGLQINGMTLPILMMVVGLSVGGFILNPVVVGFFNRHLFARYDGFLQSTRMKLMDALHVLHNAGLRRWKVYLLSLLMQLDAVLYYFVIGLAIDIRLAPWYYLIIVPIVVVLTTLPLSFNGLGLREGGLVFIAAALGLNITASQAVALGLLVLVVTMTASLAGGFFYIVSGTQQRKLSALEHVETH